MKNKSIWNEMKPYLIISFGMLVYAFAATGFLVPHKIVGGVKNWAEGLTETAFHTGSQFVVQNHQRLGKT